MIVYPYTTTFGAITTYGCKVDLENGRPMLDLQSPVELQDLDWAAIAQQMAEGEAEEAAVKDSLTAEEPPVREDSPIEAAFKRERDALKLVAIEFVQANPGCTFEELAAQAPEDCMVNPRTFINQYIAVCVENGLIPEPSFEYLKAVICAATAEELMRL